MICMIGFVCFEVGAAFGVVLMCLLMAHRTDENSEKQEEHHGPESNS